MTNGPVNMASAELAVITHSGSHDDLDLSYGALATYVSEHALAVDGLIRECYLVGPHDTDDESAWRTEIGWPIFETRPQPTMPQRTRDGVATSGAQNHRTSTPGSSRRTCEST
jgi:hypothetical protein